MVLDNNRLARFSGHNNQSKITITFLFVNNNTYKVAVQGYITALIQKITEVGNILRNQIRM